MKIQKSSLRLSLLLECLALLGEEREKVAKQQIQEEIQKKSKRLIKKPATYEVGDDLTLTPGQYTRICLTSVTMWHVCCL